MPLPRHHMQARHYHDKYKHTSAVKIQALIRRGNVRRQLAGQINAPKALTAPADTAATNHKVRTPSAKKGQRWLKTHDCPTPNQT